MYTTRGCGKHSARKLDYRVLNRKDQMKDLIVLMSKKENGNVAIK